MITLTNKQARQFLLLKHGLIGDHKFIGKQGVLDFIGQVGCIQFDPIDTCGKNAELVLQSRVEGFTKNTLDELLYSDRRLIDYPDKNLSISLVESWPYFERFRQAAREGGKQSAAMAELETQALVFIKENGAVNSKELPISGHIQWNSAIHWSGSGENSSNSARAVLEHLYSTGELIIHHKKGSRKFYDLSENYISTELLNAPDPYPQELDHQKWRVLRRIGAVGLLWNKASDAWMNIWGLKAAQRNEIVQQLLTDGKILEVEVAGVKDPLYCLSSDLDLIKLIRQAPKLKPRCELIAPLDNMLWDRKLVKALFNFDYTWEIYTPADQRQYGYYVLPLLYGDEFIARVEAVADRKTKLLIVKNIWVEPGITITAKLEKSILEALSRLAKFNEMDFNQTTLTHVEPKI